MTDTTISFLSWMAYDGFVVNVGKKERRDMNTLVNHMAELLLFGRSENTPANVG